MRPTLVAVALILTAAPPAFAQMAHPDLLVAPADAKYGPVPPSFPPGAEVAVISGNPFAEGPYVLRLKMPSGYVIPPHNHPTTENVTVLSGRFHAGMGDKLDRKQGVAFKPGGFAAMSPKMNHYAWTTSASIVQVHGMGPFAITYVNPADDPSRK